MNNLINKFLNSNPLIDSVEFDDYDSNWNSLMIVVDRIKELDYEVIIKTNNTTIIQNYSKTSLAYIHLDFCIERDGLTMIESCFNAIIEFITFFNNKKNYKDQKLKIGSNKVYKESGKGF